MFGNKQLAHGHEVPLTADSVEAPIVWYGSQMTCIHFLVDDGRWGRITFEGLDSIKVSRGEYEPFSAVSSEQNVFHWVTTISNSVWLQERYRYEKRHYENAYNFGGSVDEMLTDYSHYVFSFHDQFVEVLAVGIWFESAATVLNGPELDPLHPLLGLRNVMASEQFENHGITCHVRRNPLPMDVLEEQARLCSQVVLEVATDLDGRVSTAWTLTRRVRNGVAKTQLQNYFGHPVMTFSEIPPLASIRPTIDHWLAEVQQRRQEMGK